MTIQTPVGCRAAIVIAVMMTITGRAQAQSSPDVVVFGTKLAPARPKAVATPEPPEPDMGKCTDYRLNSSYTFFPKPTGSPAKYTTAGVVTVSYKPDGTLTASDMTAVAKACATPPATAYCYAIKQSATTVLTGYTLETDMSFAGWSAASAAAISMRCVR